MPTIDLWLAHRIGRFVLGLLVGGLLCVTGAPYVSADPDTGGNVPVSVRAGAVCVAGGPCAIGDTGPGGGIVFYDAGSVQPWGRYLEAAPAGWSGSPNDPLSAWCSNTMTLIPGAMGTAIGTGATNTAAMLAACSSGAANVIAQGTAVTPSPESSGSEVLVPSAPRAIRVTAGTRSAIIAWKAPAQTGASAVLRYRVTAIPRGRSCSTEATSCRVSGLKAGETYRFEVAARNKSGQGPAVTSKTVTIPRPEAAAPLPAPTSKPVPVLRIYTGGGKTDWFLPSKDELNALYKQRGIVGGFGTGNYWSSSQSDAYYAWYQYFPIGGQSSYHKSNADGVRPVRAF